MTARRRIFSAFRTATRRFFQVWISHDAAASPPYRVRLIEHRPDVTLFIAEATADSRERAEAAANRLHEATMRRFRQNPGVALFLNLKDWIKSRICHGARI